MSPFLSRPLILLPPELSGAFVQTALPISLLASVSAKTFNGVSQPGCGRWEMLCRPRGWVTLGS